MLRTTVVFTLLIASIVFCTANLAFPIGAPGLMTGGPGEMDCTNCHLGKLSDARPRLRLDGLTDRVKSGSHQLFTLTLTHPDMNVAGIQTVIRPLQDEHEQQDVGHLQSAQLTILKKDGLVYLNHGHPLTAKAGKVIVTVEWDVPMTSGFAILNTAMVAANGDGSPFGDSVVILEKTIEIISE